jgi:hypothetical protein
MAKTSASVFRPICAAALIGVAALAHASPAAAQSREAQRALDEAAAEFVAETFPMTGVQRAMVQAGQILPYCEMHYPDTLTQVDGSYVDVPRSEQIAIVQAVDTQVVRQNLVAAGAPDWLADTLARGYRTSRESFDQKTDPEREALVLAGESPDQILLKAANFTGRLLGLPKFIGNESCNASAYLSVIRTPYRLITEPAGASVFVIPRFSFRVCEKRVADPYSRRDCAAWVKVPEGSTAKVSGIYQYSVEWPDGAQEREKVIFETDGVATKDLLLASKPPSP